MKKKHIAFTVLIIAMTTYVLRARMDDDFQDGKTIEEWSQAYEKDHQSYQKQAAFVLTPDFDFEGLELVHVGPGPKYYSKLGHLFLRFYGSGPRPEEDLTLSFLIDANEYKIDNWAAFWGGKYAIYPLIKPFSVQIANYQKGENRTLTRYKLTIDAAQKPRLKELLKGHIQDRKQLGQWAMYDNNCSNLLNDYLLSGGVPSPYKGRQVIWPDWFVAKYLDAGLIRSVD